MFAYPIVHELLAKSSSERALVGQIINDIVGKRMLYLHYLYNWRITRTSILDNYTRYKKHLMSTSYPCTGHIVSNGYKLIDITGQPTRWGVWSPDQLNLNQSWADEHGLNSLQMLTFLLSAFHVTKNNSYWNTWKVCAVVQIGIYI